MLDRRGRALPNDYARLRWHTDPRVAFGPRRWQTERPTLTSCAQRLRPKASSADAASVHGDAPLWATDERRQV